MKRSRKFTGLLTAVLLLVVVITAHAQTENLLVNPGFEAPYEVVDGTPPREVASGWTPWHVAATAGMSAMQNVQPEYTVADAPVFSGAAAQEYMSYFATHIGGLYQSAAVTSGTEYTFSAYVYVISTAGDNPQVSDQPGGVIVQVGIDPTGGTNGESGDIVWSAPVQRYDAYNQYVVTAAAVGDVMTVWVRSSVTTPVQYNIVYVDEAALTTGSSAIAAETMDAMPMDVTPDAAMTAITDAVATDDIAMMTEAPTEALPTALTLDATAEPTMMMVDPALTDEAVIEPRVDTAAQVTDDPLAGTPTTPATGIIVTAMVTLTANTPTVVPPTATTAFTSTIVATITPPATITTAATVITATPTITFTPSPSPTLDIVTFPYSLIHTVRRNDTVFDLSRLYNSSVQAIISINQLNPNGLIFVGQQLVIPLRTPPVTPQVTVITPGTPQFTTTPRPTSTPRPTATIPSAGGVYIVRYGDTLSSIAARLGVTTAALARQNGILNPNLIFVGQRLIVPGAGVPTPAPTATRTATVTRTATRTAQPTATRTAISGSSYVVRYGDTLFGISVRFGVSLADLIRLNGISNPNLIFVGQRLTLP